MVIYPHAYDCTLFFEKQNKYFIDNIYINHYHHNKIAALTCIKMFVSSRSNVNDLFFISIYTTSFQAQKRMKIRELGNFLCFFFVQKKGAHTMVGI